MAAVIEIGSWPVLPIFEHMQKLGNVPQDEMLRTFNMGMGMLLVVPCKKFKKAKSVLERAGEKFYTIGPDCQGRAQSDVHVDSFPVRFSWVLRRAQGKDVPCEVF